MVPWLSPYQVGSGGDVFYIGIPQGKAALWKSFPLKIRQY